MPYIRVTRRFPRKPAAVPVELRVLGEAEPFEDSLTTKVLGLGGCCVVSPEPLGFASLLDLKLDFPDRSVRADGRVAYELAKDGGYEVGVEFLRLMPRDRAWLEEVVTGPSTGPVN